MEEEEKTKEQLLKEVAGLRKRISALEAELEVGNLPNSMPKGENWFRMVVESMTDGLAMADEKSVIQYVNDRNCKIIGYEREEVLGKRASDAFRILSKSGQKMLHLLSSRIMKAHEEERKRISMELHDEMGQTLTAMSINLAIIDKETSPELDPGIRERLKETRLLTDQASDQIRELSLSLRPSMLDDLGLTSTLRWYVSRYSKRLNIDVAFEILGLEERLSPEVETVVYRVVQEALTDLPNEAHKTL